MPVPPVNMTENTPIKRRYNTVKITGYAATGLAVASGVAGLSKKIKMHKWLAYLSAVFTALHIGVIEYGHKNRKS